MALFGRRQPQWEKTFRLRGHFNAAKGLLAVLFWAWGGIGLVFNASSLFGLTGGIGMGTSGSLTAACLIWIGGLLLFGIGALLSSSEFDGERPVPENSSGARIAE